MSRKILKIQTICPTNLLHFWTHFFLPRRIWNMTIGTVEEIPGLANLQRKHSLAKFPLRILPSPKLLKNSLPIMRIFKQRFWLTSCVGLCHFTSFWQTNRHQKVDTIAESWRKKNLYDLEKRRKKKIGNFSLQLRASERSPFFLPTLHFSFPREHLLLYVIGFSRRAQLLASAIDSSFELDPGICDFHSRLVTNYYYMRRYLGEKNWSYTWDTRKNARIGRRKINSRESRAWSTLASIFVRDAP